MKAVVLAFAITIVPVAAIAQPSDPLAQQLSDGGTLYDVGMGVTIAGVLTTGLGTGIFFADPANWGSIIGGGTIFGLGGLLFLSGVPTWIVGAIRSSLLNAGARRAEVAQAWETAGIAVFLSGLAVALLGGVFLGAAFSGVEDLSVPSITLLPVGVAIATFVGLPMWGDAARF